MKIEQFLGLTGALILFAGCAAESPVSSYYHDSEGNVLSATPTSTYDNTTVLSPPPRYDSYAPASQGAAASAQVMTEADRTLADQVRQRCDRALPGVSVGIDSRAGTVTLSGTLATESERTALVNAVRTTPGVVAVNDQLQIIPTATGRSDQERVYAPNAEDYFSLHVRGLNETDRTLGQRILEGLRADTVLPTLMPIVNIEVSHGRVIVRGSVQNYEQKRQILAAVRQSAGVSNVIDELQVTPPR